MKTIRFKISELEEFKKDFIKMVEENTKYLETPQPIPANAVKYKDVISFRSKLINKKPGSTNPYVCFNDEFMSSQNQTFKNSSDQILFKIGTIELTEEQWMKIEDLTIYNNK